MTWLESLVRNSEHGQEQPEVIKSSRITGNMCHVFACELRQMSDVGQSEPGTPIATGNGHQVTRGQRSTNQEWYVLQRLAA